MFIMYFMTFLLLYYAVSGSGCSWSPNMFSLSHCVPCSYLISRDLRKNCTRKDESNDSKYTVFNCGKSNYAHFIQTYFSLIFAEIKYPSQKFKID